MNIKSAIAAVIAIAETLNWSVTQQDTVLEFETYTNYGQDCLMYIDIGNFDEMCDRVYGAYSDFDVSEETYHWLDDTGHGTNGAPYEMIDVYHDMEEYQDKILELWRALYERREENA